MTHPVIPADPFTIHVSDGEIADLKARLAQTRLPNEPDGNENWDYGTNLSYMERLLTYWRDDFDWRKQEAWLNTFKQYRATITDEDGADHEIHFIYERSSQPGAIPLIMTHGWPSTFREFLDVVDRLAHPQTYGAEGPAFDVIVPSLIGYGFSSKPAQPIGPAAIAELWHKLMTDVLGYDKYAAQAGDWGSFVTSRLALQHAESLLAIHLTMLPLRPDVKDKPVTEEEAAWIKEMQAWWRQEEGYRSIQSTKPMALAFGLHDSPAGLAGWLADKYYRLGDIDKSHPWEGMEARFPMDTILTQFSIYWFTGTINSANTLYKAGPAENSNRLKRGEKVTVPTAYSEYPMDTLPLTPQSWAERGYNLKRFKIMERGGHFAAMEEPELFADDVRAAFKELLG
ncbi:epocide hydrolase domain-containing protein [Tepidicaulis marinus]|uniref:Epocide hydrolase domain-containing protein n=1 Tax=Tepidicaulis marinus TaxID=1333998 RepID=A0A081BBJ0_9HYPH|nr:epoxide hydrolase family protein [Tepidicaulis marinus]GAK45408.1 epocide hydrolase domain-containing protein [Tepidicaulis marinus]